MIGNLSLVFTNWSYSDWACEKSYTALFVYYPEIMNGSYIHADWLFAVGVVFLSIGLWLGWYVGKR